MAWKGADASVHDYVGYYDQSANAYIQPTTDAYRYNLANGYEGLNIGVSYIFAKNIVCSVNYLDLEDSVTNDDAKNIWSELFNF